MQLYDLYRVNTLPDQSPGALANATREYNVFLMRAPIETIAEFTKIRQPAVERVVRDCENPELDSRCFLFPQAMRDERAKFLVAKPTTFVAAMIQTDDAGLVKRPDRAPGTYEIVINEEQRQIITEALEKAAPHPATESYARNVEYTSLYGMFDDLPAAEAESPGTVHGFTL